MFRCSKVVAKKANKFSCNSISEQYIIQIGISLLMSDDVGAKKDVCNHSDISDRLFDFLIFLY